jgi:TatD DNase family protein
VVFAITRTQDEGQQAALRRDERLVWGWGTHPGVPEALEDFTEARASKLIDHLPLIGEVGLDRRGSLPRQQETFARTLSAAQGRPVLLSVHSTGRTKATIDVIRSYPHPGLILHWFLGTPREIAEAVELGAYFSVNAAMPEETLRQIPLDRMLPETDFPFTRRKGGGRLPGDTASVEQLLAGIAERTPLEIRRVFWTNLRRISVDTAVLDRLPHTIADLLLGL